MDEDRNGKKGEVFWEFMCAVDVKSRQITGIDITDDKSDDSKHFISLVGQSKKFGNVKVLADGAYDAKDDFSYLYYSNITPGIKTRKNSSVNTDCYPRRKSVLAQIFNYELWGNSVSHGDRWIVESVSSAFKGIFGEHVTSHTRENMIAELKLKVCLYNKMTAIELEMISNNQRVLSIGSWETQQWMPWQKTAIMQNCAISLSILPCHKLHTNPLAQRQGRSWNHAKAPGKDNI